MLLFKKTLLCLNTNLVLISFKIKVTKFGIKQNETEIPFR